MAQRRTPSVWSRLLASNVSAVTRAALRAGSRSVERALKTARAQRAPPAGAGDWLPGIALGAGGTRRWRLFRPAGVGFGERLPLLVMLHGCGQDAKTFADSTRMNRVAARERFLVLYPEQDRLANAQGCWNWFDTRSGRAHAEAASIVSAIDQVCLLYAADRSRVAVAGLSAGASMAALLATRYPQRFSAVAMHSGVAPGAADTTLSAVGAMSGRRAPRPLPATAPTAAGAMAGLPPLIVIHGGRDGVVSVHNAQAATRLWAAAGGARAGAGRVVRRGQRHPMTVTDFKRRGATVATLVEVGELGHAWSGGAAGERYADSRGPDASRMVWAFAARQFAAAPVAAGR